MGRRGGPKVVLSDYNIFFSWFASLASNIHGVNVKKKLISNHFQVQSAWHGNPLSQISGFHESVFPGLFCLKLNDLDLWPHDQKSIGFPPLIIHNLHVKFETDWTKIVVCIVPIKPYIHVPIRPYTQSAKQTLTFDPVTLNQQGFFSHHPPLTFESDWAKTVVCIVSTRSYTHSAKVNLDLWPCYPKSIGFLLSSWWMCKWGLKVIGQKL